MHKKQQGLTMISWAIIIAFLGIVMVSALNIIPSYLNYFSAKGILDGLVTDSAAKGKTAKEIKKLIWARFKVNNLRNINVQKDITFKNKGAAARAGYNIRLAYEDRGKIIGNLYFVTVFDYEVEIGP